MSLELGQSISYIKAIENKKALPSMTGFFKICEFLEITPREFYDGGSNIMNGSINLLSYLRFGKIID